MAWLINGSFENRLQGWRPVNLGNLVLNIISDDGTAYSGNSFLRVGAPEIGASVAQDFTVSNVKSLGAFAWVRSKSGAPFPFRMTLWQLSHGNRSIDTRYQTVGDGWEFVSNTIDIVGQDAANMRLEFYIDQIDTANVRLDIDAVVVA